MTEHKFETPLTEAFVTAVCNENKRLNEQIKRLREAVYEYAQHVLIMEGTDFISSIVDDDLRKLMESICHKDPAKE